MDLSHHFLNIYHFYTKALLNKLGANHERMVSKVDLFNFQKILIPIHINLNHWTLGEIDLDKKCLRYYDSLGGDGTKILKTLLAYVQNEHTLKKKKPLDVTKFTLENAKCPKQKKGNVTDCGIFIIAMADHLSKNMKFNFTQKDIPDYRNRIAFEIIKNKLFI